MKLPPFSHAAGFFFFAVAEVEGVPGDVDLSFNPNANDEVSSIATQASGELVIGGFFTTLGATSRPRCARFNLDLTLDAFNPSGNDSVQCLGIQRDGRLVLAGLFTRMGGMDRLHVARVSAGGALESGFTVSANDEARCLTFMDDDRILIGGLFTQVNGADRDHLVRLNTDGGVDAAFNPAPDGLVRNILLLPDTKILIGGNFATVGGTGRSRVARLNPNGSLDPGFNADVTGSGIYCMALQADGKVLIGGSFSMVGNVPRENIARLNVDGSLDSVFNPGANGIVRSMAVQADGRIILVGAFITAGGITRNRIARVNANGSLDLAFNPNADFQVVGALLQSDGKIVVGGNFGAVGGTTRNRIARLENNPATQNLTIPTPGRIQWLRGGSAPETALVTFELSTNGGTAWISLGRGTRIAGGWELNGLNLPEGGQIRARARITGGYGNGSQGWVQSVSTYFFAAQQLWRYEYFDTVEGVGDAADHADPDKDGLENLVEYAFGLNPVLPDAASLPSWQHEDDDWILSFERPPYVSGITYVAEQSETLAGDSWIPIPNAASPPAYHFSVPAWSERRLFLRLRVTAP